MESVRCILFDLDGTLVDSLPDIALAVNRMRESFALSPLPETVVSGLIGSGIETLVRRATEGEKVDPEAALQRTRDFYRAHPVELSRAYPGVPEGLRRLRACGFRLGVVTNKPRDIAEILRSHLALEGSYFQSAEVAGPGFINMRFNQAAKFSVVRDVLEKAESFGSSSEFAGKSVLLEYVSANPYKDTGAEKYKRNIYGNSQQNQATAETTSAEGTNFAAFMPEITPQNKNMVYNQASNIYNAPLKAEQQNITQTAQDFSYSRLDYALNAYNYVKEVNQEPKILINLMHPNNRNFHYEA